MSKKNNELSLKDLKKVNDELEKLQKEIKKEIKSINRSLLDEFNGIDLSLDYKSTIFTELTPEQIEDELLLTSLIKKALIDVQELLKKGTEYGVKLAFDRIKTIHNDRQIVKSPFLIEGYREYESNIWNVVKLRELCYGEIEKLKAKQDNITLSALKEVDSMMRVRYFEDIKILEKDILRLENEAHQYNNEELAVRNEKVLKDILKKYSTPSDELPTLIEFEKNIRKYERKD